MILQFPWMGLMKVQLITVSSQSKSDLVGEDTSVGKNVAEKGNEKENFVQHPVAKTNNCNASSKVENSMAADKNSPVGCEEIANKSVVKPNKKAMKTNDKSWKATHFIAPDPIPRTEKFFAAAASGRWFLKTDHLSVCNQAGKFLAEEPYEWHKNGLSEDGAINLESPRKWHHLRERTGLGAFYGMRIIVYGECIAPSLKSFSNLTSRAEQIVEDLTIPRSLDECGSNDVTCQVCGSRERGEVMLICGDESGSLGCGNGTHIDCCEPPLEDVPEEDWFCPKCSRRSRNSTTPSKKRKEKKKRNLSIKGQVMDFSFLL
ncbi:hypothetical protein CRYUN_Cryun20dG0056100 [Craigia yunnanensis]